MKLTYFFEKSRDRVVKEVENDKNNNTELFHTTLYEYLNAFEVII